MFTFLRAISNRELLLEQMPIFFVSFLIANTFYKFGSFGLEVIAFLATWFVIDASVQLLHKLLKK
ncbi:hypothetical protein [Paraglaciecola sp. L1A13]|uniref:hypothetical protein n=1 Tax=Paraglaciecola sp. L1A13 TaxID=2686359 RepID=UPI00131D301B|nr:hypothetical protein [Paraglaciecola sp. L1A13]